MVEASIPDGCDRFGHRRNIQGFREALEFFDSKIPIIKENLEDEDLLMITADHGNDPTFKGTDHTREMVPILVYHNRIDRINLGIRNTFSDISATILEYFRVEKKLEGTSFLSSIKPV